MPFRIKKSSNIRGTRDPTDPILDTGFLNVPHAQGTLRACHIMEAKIMKHHVLPRELAKFWRKTSAVFRMKRNFLRDIVLRAQLKTVQTVSS